MTPEARAASCMEWLCLAGAEEHRLRNMQAEIAAQIREAVAEEREACAQIADGAAGMEPWVAAAIRARAEPAPEP